MSHIYKVGGGLLAAALVLSASSADAARAHSITRHVQGRFGHGFTDARTIGREPGAVSVSGERTYNDGRTASRSRSAMREADGTIGTARSHTGIAGNTQSGWSTIYRTDNGYTRSGAVSTSSGRWATGSKSVAVGEDSVTVDRSVTTGSGKSWSDSRTYDRER